MDGKVTTLATCRPGHAALTSSFGDSDLTGLGHGPAFIRQHVASLFADGAPVVATDPHPDNTRAIKAYRKAGFREIGPPRDTKWGTILPMLVEP